jgi:hypothetical protein
MPEDEPCRNVKCFETDGVFRESSRAHRPIKRPHEAWIYSASSTRQQVITVACETGFPLRNFSDFVVVQGKHKVIFSSKWGEK